MARHTNKQTIVAFLVGIGIGAVAALLLARQTGDELRDNIVDAIGKGADQVRSKTEDLGRASQKLVDAAREQVQYALKAGANVVRQAKTAAG